MDRNRSALERHVQTGLLAAVLGLLGWLLYEVNDQGKALASLTPKVDQVGKRVEELAREFDRYLLKSEGVAQFDATNARIDELRDRVQRLEDRGQR